MPILRVLYQMENELGGNAAGNDITKMAERVGSDARDAGFQQDSSMRDEVMSVASNPPTTQAFLPVTPGNQIAAGRLVFAAPDPSRPEPAG